jgi:hypothetical protein
MPEPRLGVAYDLFGNGKTAIKASFGLHRALLDTLDYRLDQVAPFNTTLSFSNTTVGQLPTLAAGGGHGLVSPSNVQQDIQTPTVEAWTLKVEQEVAPRTTLAVGYIGSHGYHQILSEDQNTPAYVTCPSDACAQGLAAGTVYYTSTKLANPNLANSTSWVSQGMSNYNGLEVDVRHQFSQGLQLRGVYTWSRNLDNGSAWNTSVSANTPAFVSFPGNPTLDYGPAATNIAHAAAINGTWELPIGQGRALLANASPAAQKAIAGWTLSGIATLQSGFPFSPQLGYNPTGNGDTRNPARPQLNPDFHGSLYAGKPSGWFNPEAFVAPYPGTFGNTSRDSLVGPGLKDIDLSLGKNIALYERLHVQFRAEYFNLLNHSNFTTPNAVVFSSGPTPAKPATAAALSPTAGLITATSTTSRQLQFGLKLLF